MKIIIITHTQKKQSHKKAKGNHTLKVKINIKYTKHRKAKIIFHNYHIKRRIIKHYNVKLITHKSKI